MADLDDKQAALTVKIAGANVSSGVESNYADVDASGNIKSVVNNASGASAVNIQDGGNSITVDALSLPLPTGAATETTLAANGVLTGAVAETAPASDTASSGLNGRLQRIAQRLTSLIALLPTSIGQKAMTGSLSVAIASDQSSVAVTPITAGPVTPGTVATKSDLIGGQYNSTLPVLTGAQQAALQVDSSGRLIVSPIQTSGLPPTGSQFSFGQLNTNTSAAYLAVEFTAYTEPTTNSTMTIVSASANDTSAGTGARTVTVTYLDQTGAGPFTTTFTMNGTTPVTAGVSNMCFVEKIVVSTVGSTGSNVGIITLKTGGAVTVGTMAATNNQTYWAHHYIPINKICYISGFSFGNNSTAAGNGAQFILKASTPTVANTPELQISDFIDIAGASSTDTRSYISPIQISGPARIRAYVLPYANAATTQFASFDFIEI